MMRRLASASTTSATVATASAATTTALCVSTRSFIHYHDGIHQGGASSNRGGNQRNRGPSNPLEELFGFSPMQQQRSTRGSPASLFEQRRQVMQEERGRQAAARRAQDRAAAPRFADLFQFMNPDAQNLRGPRGAPRTGQTQQPRTTTESTPKQQQRQSKPETPTEKSQPKQQQQQPDFPFNNLFRSMFDVPQQQAAASKADGAAASSGGASSPFNPFFHGGPFSSAGSAGVTIHEGATNATATIDIPAGFTATAPKVEHNPKGSLLVTADVVPQTHHHGPGGDDAEAKADAHSQADQVQQFLQQLGLNVDVKAGSNGNAFWGGSGALPLRRSFNLNPTEYNLDGAKAYVEADGQLMVYVPKHKLPTEPVAAKQVTPPATNDTTTKPPAQSRVRRLPDDEPTAATSTSSKSAEQAATSTESSPISAASQPSSEPAPTSTPVAADNWKPRTHVQWPPTVSTVEDSKLNLIYSVNLPAEVKPEALDLHYDSEKNRLTVVVEHDHIVTTPVSEEKQHFSFTRHLELPDTTKCTPEQVEKMLTTIESHYNKEDATLAISIEKPQPPKTARTSSANSIPIKIQHKK